MEENSAPSKRITVIELVIYGFMLIVCLSAAIPSIGLYRAHSCNKIAEDTLKIVVASQRVLHDRRNQFWDCLDSGCNEPILPGLSLPQGVSLSCTVRNGGDQVLCTARHEKGDVSFYYDSNGERLWQA